MSDKNVNVTSSFPVIGLLGLLFVGLKLANVIDWSWWFVLMPFYLLPGLLLLAAGFVLCVGAAFSYFAKKRGVK